ncbi:CCHC-type domain-containing protein [Caerostris darwini]|uniref:CCHC-type domain-containing protein n=1 Tax=Caerostris darwini TaxID=1538125 RepID=A0AAV4WLY4_9ARAC|nr:CCHC-type domain-containing protein [Caerostris darwini]
MADEWAKFTLPTKLADRSDENDSVHSTTSKSFGAIPKERVRPRTPPLVRPLKKELLFSSQITSKGNQQHRNKYLLKSNFKLTFFICGEEGHSSKFCMKNRQSRNTPVTSQSNLVQASTTTNDNELEGLTVEFLFHQEATFSNSLQKQNISDNHHHCQTTIHSTTIENQRQSDTSLKSEAPTKLITNIQGLTQGPNIVKDLVNVIAEDIISKDLAEKIFNGAAREEVDIS